MMPFIKAYILVVYGLCCIVLCLKFCFLVLLVLLSSTMVSPIHLRVKTMKALTDQ